MELQELGFAIGKGIVRQIADYVLIFLIISMVFRFAANQFDWWVDDSDKNGHNRSGLKILTDHKTGIQYLSDGKGGLIQRGKP
jgi:hypothetical protein